MPRSRLRYDRKEIVCSVLPRPCASRRKCFRATAAHRRHLLRMHKGLRSDSSCMLLL